MSGEAGKKTHPFACYVLTRPGLVLAEEIVRGLDTDLHIPARLKDDTKLPSISFESLGAHLRKTFLQYQGHVIIAATGLVVREIAPLLKDKKTDPAVVALGQDGRFVISLLSGHLGGGNELAQKIADITKGQAVINTATDIAKVPALEMIARDLGLHVEDFKRLPAVSRALAEGETVPLYDPKEFLGNALNPWRALFPPIVEDAAFQADSPEYPQVPSIYVDYRKNAFPKESLLLVPKVLFVGIGCHRGISFDLVQKFVEDVFAGNRLLVHAVKAVATVETRRAEPALLELASSLKAPLEVYAKEDLSKIQSPNPSEMVLKNIGVPSVCEAAAMLAAKTDRLLVPKQKSHTVTLAVAVMEPK